MKAPDRWSLASYFSGFGEPDYLAFKSALQQDLADLLERVGGSPTPAVDDLLAYEALSARFGHLSSFLGCLSADDGTNDAVKAEEAWLAVQSAGLSKIGSTLCSVLAALSGAEASAIADDPRLDGAGYAVGRLREQGRRLMAPAFEALAADLNVDGIHAWGRLYDTLTGRLEFSMTFPDGHVETVPMARRRALMADPDPAIRRAAFRDGQVPWETHVDSFAAAINGIAGTRLSLAKRRKLPDFLSEPLFDGGMRHETLEALFEALRSGKELSLRALRASAKLQGKPLHYCDLEAPQVPAPDDLKISWDDACGIVHRAFHEAYPALGGFFDEMLGNCWIEAEPRAGKRPGAFCTDSHVIGEQRVFMTYHGTINDVVTLAHEVGHAWHSHLLKDERPLASSYPMPLAETASNFGEMILLNGLERDPSSSPALLAYLLDQQINRAHAYLVNIPMRFAFEKSFYEARGSGEVSPSGLRGLMEAAQREWYGDTLAADGLDPMFWASKLHFFISGLGFYNFPYVFGYLLSQGLFARFQAEGADFLPVYEVFLRRTGSADCEEVVRGTLGVDISDASYWAETIRSFEPQVTAYEKLAAG